MATLIIGVPLISIRGFGILYCSLGNLDPAPAIGIHTLIIYNHIFLSLLDVYDHRDHQGVILYGNKYRMS